MELKEELLDEENEKILNKLDNMLGLSKNKNVLRDIIKYAQVMKEGKFDIEFENYNIVIRNESAYNLYEELINIIAEIYYKNGIISNQEILYMSRENFRLNKTENNEIEQGLIVIDLKSFRRDASEFRKFVIDIIKQMPKKSFVILEDSFIEGEINAILNDYVSWAMKIESISTEEKEKYIRNFMESNNLICNEEIITELSNNPFWKIKNSVINILVNCKRNKEKNVSNVFKIENKSKEKVKSKKTGMEELESLTGLEDVKEQIKKVINYIKLSKNHKNMPMLHMCFNGNPGTGKTTVARIVGKIFSEENILSNKEVFVEAQRGDLIGKYVGHTAPQTQRIINKALGGVLFIDEAYSIASYIQDEGGRDFGAECIATLLKGMEDNRDNLCVILAGYTKEMEHMLNVNPGFESRIQFTINFPDYTSEELYEIFKKLCKEEKYNLSSNIKKLLIKQFDKAREDKNFSNARYVRNLFEKIKIEHANRVMNENNSNDNKITAEDVEMILSKIKNNEPQKKKIGFAC